MEITGDRSDAIFFIPENKIVISDFLVMTNKGMLVALETKGDHLVDDTERSKVFLGRAWQNAAGYDKFRYFMVYQHKDLDLEGAYHFDGFMGIIKSL